MANIYYPSDHFMKTKLKNAIRWAKSINMSDALIKHGYNPMYPESVPAAGYRIYGDFAEHIDFYPVYDREYHRWVTCVETPLAENKHYSHENRIYFQDVDLLHICRAQHMERNFQTNKQTVNIINKNFENILSDFSVKLR